MKSVSQLGDLAGKRVVVRCDFNVPLDGDKNITDDGRIRAALPTLNELRDAGARIVILAHLGRPKGEPDPKFSLAPVAARLGELLGARVKLATDVVGPSAKATVESLGDGEVALLENVRFEAGEKSKDEAARKELAEKYAAFGDFFVSNGFGVVHRKEASVYDIAKLLPSAAGSLVKAEIDVLEGLTENPKRPFVVVLGGEVLAGVGSARPQGAQAQRLAVRAGQPPGERAPAHARAVLLGAEGADALGDDEPGEGAEAGPAAPVPAVDRLDQGGGALGDELVELRDARLVPLARDVAHHGHVGPVEDEEGAFALLGDQFQLGGAGAGVPQAPGQAASGVEAGLDGLRQGDLLLGPEPARLVLDDVDGIHGPSLAPAAGPLQPCGRRGTDNTVSCGQAPGAPGTC